MIKLDDSHYYICLCNTTSKNFKSFHFCQFLSFDKSAHYWLDDPFTSTNFCRKAKIRVQVFLKKKKKTPRKYTFKLCKSRICLYDSLYYICLYSTTSKSFKSFFFCLFLNFDKSAHYWYDDHFTSTYFCGGVIIGVQVFREKKRLHTYIHLDSVKVGFV